MSNPLAYVVEVNEGVVEATTRGADWWYTFRSRFEDTGRIHETKRSCVIGGVVEVACDDEEHATSLADTMVEVGELPRGAVCVKRATRERVGEVTRA